MKTSLTPERFRKRKFLSSKEKLRGILKVFVQLQLCTFECESETIFSNSIRPNFFSKNNARRNINSLRRFIDSYAETFLFPLTAQFSNRNDAFRKTKLNAIF